MSMRPVALPDTAATAGFDHLDPISQFFTGGNGAAATATGIDDDDRYGIDLKNSGSGGKTFRSVSGDGSKSFSLDNSGISFSGGLTVAGGLVVSTGGASIVGGLSVSGAATFTSTATFTGAVTFTSAATFMGAANFTGAASFYSTAVFTGAATFRTAVTMLSTLDVTGTGTFQTTVTVQAGILNVNGPSNDQSLFLRYSASSGSFSLGAHNSATPNLIFKNNAGSQAALLSNAGAFTIASSFLVSTGGAAITGASTVVGTLTVTALSATGGSSITAALTIATGGLSITTGSATIATTLTVNAAGGQSLECDGSRNVVVGTGSIATNATDGYLYIPSMNGAPSGTPTSKSGYAAFMYRQDTARLYAYQGAWRSVAVA